MPCPSLIPPWEMVFLTCRAYSPIPALVTPGDGRKTYFPAVGISGRGYPFIYLDLFRTMSVY